MYPSYKRRDVLEEYAIVFLALLNEGYRQENEHYLMLATIEAIPRMDKKDADNILERLKWAATDAGDILSSSDDYSGLADLKRIMG